MNLKSFFNKSRKNNPVKQLRSLERAFGRDMQNPEAKGELAIALEKLKEEPNRILSYFNDVLCHHTNFERLYGEDALKEVIGLAEGEGIMQFPHMFSEGMLSVATLYNPGEIKAQSLPACSRILDKMVLKLSSR